MFSGAIKNVISAGLRSSSVPRLVRNSAPSSLLEPVSVISIAGIIGVGGYAAAQVAIKAEKEFIKLKPEKRKKVKNWTGVAGLVTAAAVAVPRVVSLCRGEAVTPITYGEKTLVTGSVTCLLAYNRMGSIIERPEK
jgi:hypothetical protein